MVAARCFARSLPHEPCRAGWRQGEGDRLAIQGDGVRWTYAELQHQVNRIANELVEGLGLVSGNTMGNLIYILLVIAIVLLLVRFIGGRRL